jgi:hypothetical protein
MIVRIMQLLFLRRMWHAFRSWRARRRGHSN